MQACPELGCTKPREAVDGGGFTRAVLPQKAENFAGGDIERQVVEGDFVAVVLGELLCGNHTYNIFLKFFQIISNCPSAFSHYLTILKARPKSGSAKSGNISVPFIHTESHTTNELLFFRMKWQRIVSVSDAVHLISVTGYGSASVSFGKILTRSKPVSSTKHTFVGQSKLPA
jgi:hypothetical protein